MKRGYTLIEFLVALAILTILAGILYPVFMRAHEPRRHSSCGPNLKQIGLGILQYTQDYDERLPPCATRNAASQGQEPPWGWVGLIQPYVRSTQLLQCPTETSPSSRSTRRSGFCDYWMNARLGGRAQNWLGDPSHTFLCGEGNDGHDRTDARYALPSWPSTWSSEPSPTVRHLGTANFLFADGHVKALSLPQILASQGFVTRFERLHLSKSSKDKA